MTKNMRNYDQNSKEIIKRLLLERHMAFTEYFFKYKTGVPMIVNRHHWVIAKTLDRVFSGEITRLIINIAPRYTKTEMAVTSFIARGFAINPASEFMHTSYSEDLAMKNSSSVRDIIAHPAYQQFWPLSFKKDSQAKKIWRIADYDGGLLAMPAGGTITGFGAGKMTEGFSGALIIDDPLKPRDAYSDTKRTTINASFNDTFMSRLAHNKVPIILIMQRIHDSDMTGHLLKGGNGEYWHHLCLPTEIVEGSKYDYNEYPYGIPVEHNLKPGALWPYKHTLEDIQNLRKTDPYVAAAQYDQSPSPLGGAIFRDEWWQYYDNSVPIHFEYLFMTGDTATKTETHHDFSVVACWGIYKKNLYLIDLLRGKWESPELKQNIEDFWNKYHIENIKEGRLRFLAVEDKSSGTDIIQNLRRDKGIIIRAIQRNRDKVSRAMDTVPYLATGRVFLPTKTAFLSDFKQ